MFGDAKQWYSAHFTIFLEMVRPAASSMLISIALADFQSKQYKDLLEQAPPLLLPKVSQDNLFALIQMAKTQNVAPSSQWSCQQIFQGRTPENRSSTCDRFRLPKH